MLYKSVNIQGLNPSEVVLPSSIEEYRNGLNRIWEQLFLLNSNLFILQKIHEFPEPLFFLDPSKQDFFALVQINFVQYSMMIVSKLTIDNDADCLTFTKFSNWIRSNIKSEYLYAFNEAMKKTNVVKRRNRYSLNKIKEARDNFLAHLLIDQNMHPKIAEIQIAVEEILSICEYLNEQFSVLCFNEEHGLLPIEYAPNVQHPIGSDARSDIEYYLDLIVQNSDFFRMPDESPYWNMVKTKYSKELIDILNKYRRKFGKPEI